MINASPIVELMSSQAITTRDHSAALQSIVDLRFLPFSSTAPPYLPLADVPGGNDPVALSQAGRIITPMSRTFSPNSGAKTRRYRTGVSTDFFLSELKFRSRSCVTTRRGDRA